MDLDRQEKMERPWLGGECFFGARFSFGKRLMGVKRWWRITSTRVCSKKKVVREREKCKEKEKKIELADWG